MELRVGLLTMGQEVKLVYETIKHHCGTCAVRFVLINICHQTFVVRMGCLTPCRTFPQMTSQTLPARQPSSMTQSSLSGQHPDRSAIIFLLFSHQFYVFVFVFFSDAKKKLRLALCSADSLALPILTPATTRNGLPDHMESEGGSVFD